MAERVLRIRVKHRECWNDTGSWKTRNIMQVTYYKEDLAPITGQNYRKVLGPGSGDRKGESRALDVYEEGCSVGRKDRAGKFRVVHGVSDDRIYLATRSYAPHVISETAIFTEDQVAPRRDRNIVELIHELGVVRLNKQFKCSGL
jgi:hypothetical protein